LDFHFGADSLVSRVSTSARARDVNGRTVPTPWQARILRYEEHGGMKIPMAAKVEWLLPEGPQPYWRGEIVEIAFESW
jgi:predicted secreted hydrolase